MALCLAVERDRVIQLRRLKLTLELHWLWSSPQSFFQLLQKNANYLFLMMTGISEEKI